MQLKLKITENKKNLYLISNAEIIDLQTTAFLDQKLSNFFFLSFT